jgi:hypothetical protein
MIDRGDEFQLVDFILSFKKMQFFTVGCFNGILGYILFYQCSSFNPYHNLEEAKEYFFLIFLIFHIYFFKKN